MKDGAASATNEGEALATMAALVENAADADEGDASVAIEEYGGSAKDICSAVPVEIVMDGRANWSVNM